MRYFITRMFIFGEHNKSLRQYDYWKFYSNWTIKTESYLRNNFLVVACKYAIQNTLNMEVEYR